MEQEAVDLSSCWDIACTLHDEEMLTTEELRSIAHGFFDGATLSLVLQEIIQLEVCA